MLDSIKYQMQLKTIDKNISEGNFDLALQKLNSLIREEFRPSETYLKRGRLCKKLLMYEDAYSDFTYVIGHCAQKQEAYYERLFLNFEISNFYEAINDANVILTWDEENFEVKRIKLLSYIYTNQDDLAKAFVLELFDYHKYRTIQFLFKEVAIVLTKDEYLKGLRLLDVIDSIDKDNPITIGHTFAWDIEPTVEEVDVISVHDYFCTHKEVAGTYESVKAVAKHSCDRIADMIEDIMKGSK